MALLYHAPILTGEAFCLTLRLAPPTVAVAASTPSTYSLSDEVPAVVPSYVAA
ncbi:hypothetical protein LDC_0596, partial [sediment metagenome]